MSTNQSRVQHGLENANLILLEILIKQVLNNKNESSIKLANAIQELDDFMHNKAGSK